MIDWLNVINKLKKEKPDLYFTRVCRPYCRKDFIPQTFIPDLRKYFDKGR